MCTLCQGTPPEPIRFGADRACAGLRRLPWRMRPRLILRDQSIFLQCFPQTRRKCRRIRLTSPTKGRLAGLNFEAVAATTLLLRLSHRNKGPTALPGYLEDLAPRAVRFANPQVRASRSPPKVKNLIRVVWLILARNGVRLQDSGSTIITCRCHG